MSAVNLTVAQAVLIRRSVELLNQLVLDVITSECSRPHEVWLDTRPMLHPYEHSGPVIDQHAEILSYAEQAGLIARHPSRRHFVRIVT